MCVCVIPAPPCSADSGMVLMMVFPGFEVVGETPRMVGLVAVEPACAVLRIVVCLPSADDTNFRMVPGGRPPFVWGEGLRVNVSYSLRELSRV